MLHPQNYPRLIGKALVLEPEPFVEMVDDDNPWVEGLFLCACIGVLTAVAQVIGGLLLSGSLPPAEVVLNLLLQALRQLVTNAETLLEVERTLGTLWPFLSMGSGYDSGWLRLLTLVVTPFGLIAQWLLFGITGHLVARAVGGQGSLGQTLGAMALSNGPRLLYILTIIPFVSIGGILIHVWGILIAYRGMEVAHELPPTRAAVAVVGPWLLVLVSFLVGGGLGALIVVVGDIV